jgi:RNA polymerase sigma-70 factor, ECF subfamily
LGQSKKRERLFGDLWVAAPAGSRTALTLEQKVTRYFEQYREAVYRYLAAVFGDAALAEDVTQDAFLHLYRSLHSGEGIADVKAWVFRVARNLALNQVKRAQFVTPLDSAAWTELVEERGGAALDPEQALLRREKLARLNAGIATLNAGERECLFLRARGLRYREIAELVDLSTTAVAETLYRAIAKLAKDT